MSAGDRGNTLAETVFLRLVREGAAKMLAGLHCRVPQRLPGRIDEQNTPLWLIG
jgi:hypothetical protein